jgi:hypothetical protein
MPDAAMSNSWSSTCRVRQPAQPGTPSIAGAGLVNTRVEKCQGTHELIVTHIQGRAVRRAIAASLWVDWKDFRSESVVPQLASGMSGIWQAVL